ncbi:hypothetical protein GF359_04500 [candidate division WOR-3 bacterium]|uniref:FlgD/Vpr Ig-like domain-containing protein n=1 Tax=candidate division WOR-3 bacterium TaxID=2052148 RepID=A0A9D5QDV9_UNCW3|nr:hypothetical protein [candidate division WOR-3 bacterium]MBD3364455.1 hypothetical protein [candidate division WOR-3 bacterium]
MLKKLMVLCLAGVLFLMAGPAVTEIRIDTDSPLNRYTVPLTSLNSTGNDTEPGQWGEVMAYPEASNNFNILYKAGVTTYDQQQNTVQGNRVVPYPQDDDTCVHVCWTYSPDEEAAHPNRAIHWNVWSEKTMGFTDPTPKVSGAFKAGYTTMGLLSDGRAVVAFHQRTGGDQYYSHVAVEAAPGFRTFNLPVAVSLNSFEGDYPIWPHIVIGLNDVIHVVASNHEADYPGVAYSRSTDEGGSFSEWVKVSDYAGADVGVACSPDGEKVCVTWTEELIEDKMSSGNVMYRESTDGGLTWGDPVNITEDRYLQDGFPMDDEAWRIYADWGSPSAAYDRDGNLHIVFEEGAYSHHTDDGIYINYLFYHRIAYWNSQTNEFSLPSGPFGCWDMVFEDTATGEPVLDTTFYDWALWGIHRDYFDYPTEGDPGENETGCWKPQLAFDNNGNIVVAFAGKHTIYKGDDEDVHKNPDVSIAGLINGDVYVTVSPDGQEWYPLKDFDFEGNRDFATAHEAYVTNVTHTITKDGNPEECADESQFTIWPYATGDNILHLTYLRDMFADPALPDYATEDYYTTNPIFYQRVKLNMGERNGTFNPDGTHYPPLGGSALEYSDIDEEPVVEAAGVELVGSNLADGSVSFNISGSIKEGSLKVYDVSGSLVKTVFEGSLDGPNTLTWDRTDNGGKSVSQGVYFYSFQTPEVTTSGRFVLVH